MTSIGPKPFPTSPAIPSTQLRPQPGPVALPPPAQRAPIDSFEAPVRTSPSTARKPLPEPPKPLPPQHPTDDPAVSARTPVKGPSQPGNSAGETTKAGGAPTKTTTQTPTDPTRR
ncbi:hypothetical protein [Pyxidicoccus caerfyrddinensis]|uniref:hypothetical protein n=1 Tax=Pyxidicoccus caerfyrddinensis TaxID=2709663 RepID=UPI0013DCC4CD|nr:hypothetical protein [Pyxidicoccus caerfyrddinensis]